VEKILWNFSNKLEKHPEILSFIKTTFQRIPNNERDGLL
jgi:hypothetical protein